MVKKCKHFALGLLLLSLLVSPLYVSAHPGRTDSSDGHHCWTNCSKWGYAYGDYHYHNGGSQRITYIYDYKNGWVNSNGSWYYYDDSGYVYGWQNINSKWYYFGYYGVMSTGWISDNGTWYYLDPSGAMKTGWLYQGGKWYFLSDSGAMKTGWVKDKSKWYYLNENGAMHTGWINDNGDWYYLDQSGAMKTGWIQIGYRWYYLYPNGVMAHDTVINGFPVGFDGAWIDNALVSKISSIVNNYKLKVYADNDYLATIYDGNKKVIDVSYNRLSGQYKYKDMMIDIALKLKPNLATKKEWSNAIDTVWGNGQSMLVGEYGIVWDNDGSLVLILEPTDGFNTIN